MADLGAQLETQLVQAASAAAQAYPTLGLVVALINGAQTREFTFGQQNKPTADSVFEIADITKAFTGTVLSYLEVSERQKLVLRQPLKDVSASPELDTFPREINWRNVLTHTAGLPSEPPNLVTGVDAIDAPFERPYSRYTTEDLLAFMDGFQLPPGALGTYNYSDVGYGMLGWALHDLYKSQATWESLTEDIVTRQLGLADTRANLTPRERDELMLPTYLGDDGNRTTGSKLPEVEPMVWDNSALTPAMGLKSTLKDMVKWVRVNMAAAGAPEASKEFGPLLGKLPELSIAMQRAQEWQVGYNPGETRGVGFGWGLEQWSGTRGNSTLVWHAGSTYGSSAFVAFNADMETGVVVLANQGRGKDWAPEELGYGVVDRWFTWQQAGATAEAAGAAPLRCAGAAVATAALLGALLLA